jgi:hypothetical protein
LPDRRRKRPRRGPPGFPVQSPILLCSRELLARSRHPGPGSLPVRAPTCCVRENCWRRSRHPGPGSLPVRAPTCCVLGSCWSHPNRGLSQISPTQTANTAGTRRRDLPAGACREFPHEPGHVTFGKPHRDQSGPPAFPYCNGRRAGRAGPATPLPGGDPWIYAAPTAPRSTATCLSG